jgi:hypothetical protein
MLWQSALWQAHRLKNSDCELAMFSHRASEQHCWLIDIVKAMTPATAQAIWR